MLGNLVTQMADGYKQKPVCKAGQILSFLEGIQDRVAHSLESTAFAFARVR
jgi:hypothetical protein